MKVDVDMDLCQNYGQCVFEAPEVPLRQRRSIELRSPGGAGDHVEVSELIAHPPGGDDRLGQDFLGLRSSENIGDVDTRRRRDIKAGRGIRLRIHVDDQGRNSPVVCGRGKTECHGRLTDSAFEAADT